VRTWRLERIRQLCAPARLAGTGRRPAATLLPVPQARCGQHLDRGRRAAGPPARPRRPHPGRAPTTRPSRHAQRPPAPPPRPCRRMTSPNGSCADGIVRAVLGTPGEGRHLRPVDEALRRPHDETDETSHICDGRASRQPPQSSSSSPSGTASAAPDLTSSEAGQGAQRRASSARSGSAPPPSQYTPLRGAEGASVSGSRRGRRAKASGCSRPGRRARKGCCRPWRPR